MKKGSAMKLDPVQYLVNIILVAQSDGKLSSSELSLIESIRSELKVKKSELTSALRLIEQGTAKIIPVGSFADQVRNLEYIIRVAYADNDSDDTEILLIKDFSQAVGVSPEQLQRMQNDVLALANDQVKHCPSCGASSDAQALFCQKCGTNLSASENVVQVDFKIPSSGIAIEFAQSTAASFPKALELAKATDGFQSCLRNKKIWYLALYPSKDLNQIIPLCDALSGIRNRRVHIDGEEMPWDEVFGFVWCAARRAAAYRPIEYCFGKEDNRINPWGCKNANMEWAEWARWFSYGKWEKGGFFGGKFHFRFDKERIKHELATNLFRFRFCPYLRTDLSEVFLKNLPDTISPDTDNNWSYRRTYDQSPGSIKVLEKQGGYSVEYWSDGVSPNGMKFFNEILIKSLSDTGCQPILLNI